MVKPFHVNFKNGFAISDFYSKNTLVECGTEQTFFDCEIIFDAN